MSFITTKFHEILLSCFGGVALKRKTGLTDRLADEQVNNIILSTTRSEGFKNSSFSRTTGSFQPIGKFRDTCSSVKEEFLVPTHSHWWVQAYTPYIGITFLILLYNLFRSFCKSIIPRKVPCYTSDKLITAKINFVCIFELISISTQLLNDTEWINNAIYCNFL